jgi:enediyne biosynthesis protein E4
MDGRMNRHLSRLAAIVLVAVCYTVAKIPAFTTPDTTLLAARFSFEKLPLAEVSEDRPQKLVRNVHPSLERISAWVSSLGAAATLADLDGDGMANDLVYVDPRTDVVAITPVPGSGERYRPFALDNTFWSHNGYDVSTVAPMGTLAGDFNEDGLLDLMVYFWGRSPVLYLRNTDGAMSFAARELVESAERWYSNCATQADFDGDGHVDLFIGNYFQDGAKILHAKDSEGTVVMHEGKSKAANGGKDRLLLWQGQAHFKEIPDALPDAVARQWGLAAGAADLDGDHLPELYIANDFGPDHLLHNRSKPGNLKFARLEGRRDLMTPKSCVLGQDSFKGMGVDFGDLNGDGLLDIYVSNIAAKFALTESHFVWLSTGETNKMKEGIAPYVNASERLGLSRSGFSWEARLADFDNDGVLEAMQACGFIKGKINRWPELQALGTSNDQIIHNPRFWPNFRPGADLSGHDCNPFFARGADGKYHNVAAQLGLAEPLVTRGIAIADVDSDGRLDFVTANQWGPSYFFRNRSPNTGAFLGLRLVHANRSPAIGAVAKVLLPDGARLVAQVDGGTGHSGRRSPEIHFGLGTWEKSKALRVKIEWRDRNGAVQKAIQELTPGWHTVELRTEDRLAKVR